MRTDPAPAGAGPAPAGGVFVGVGMSSAATAAEVGALVDRVLDEAAAGSLGAVATLESLTADPRLAALGAPVIGFAAGELGSVTGVQPSPAALAAAGTPSVAEAAALLAAGPGGVLAVTKRRSEHATAAVALRRAQPPAATR